MTKYSRLIRYREKGGGEEGRDVRGWPILSLLYLHQREEKDSGVIDPNLLYRKGGGGGGDCARGWTCLSRGGERGGSRASARVER